MALREEGNFFMLSWLKSFSWFSFGRSVSDLNEKSKKQTSYQTNQDLKDKSIFHHYKPQHSSAE